MNAPWIITPQFIEMHKAYRRLPRRPRTGSRAQQIDYVAHDAEPYKDTTGQADDGETPSDPPAPRGGLGLDDDAEGPANLPARDTASDVYAPVKKMGKFAATQRTDGVSTSGTWAGQRNRGAPALRAAAAQTSSLASCETTTSSCGATSPRVRADACARPSAGSCWLC